MAEMRIQILELGGGIHLGQSRRTHLDEESFRPFDLLSRDQNVGILLQGGQNRLFQGKSRRGARTCFTGRLAGVGPQSKKGNCG